MSFARKVARKAARNVTGRRKCPFCEGTVSLHETAQGAHVLHSQPPCETAQGSDADGFAVACVEGWEAQSAAARTDAVARGHVE